MQKRIPKRTWLVHKEAFDAVVTCGQCFTQVLRVPDEDMVQHKIYSKEEMEELLTQAHCENCDGKEDT